KMVTGTLPPVIAGVSDDSRTVGQGECFIAVPGLRHDARRFIPAAVGRGAALVVTEGAATSDVSVAQVVVPSAREAVALLGDAWHGHPSRAMTLVGITGTNGKTTTSYLVEALLGARGLRTGVLGTIRYVGGTTAVDANQTTPDALKLVALLARMRAAGLPTDRRAQRDEPARRHRRWPGPGSRARGDRDDAGRGWRRARPLRAGESRAAFPRRRRLRAHAGRARARPDHGPQADDGPAW